MLPQTTKALYLQQSYKLPVDDSEHLTLRRAIDRGVSPERLAKALSVDDTHIQKKANLLNGIFPEATDLLKDQQFSPELVRAIRKMKPTRQVECVELMTSANNLTIAYAEALLVATPTSLLVDGKKPRKLTGISQEQMAKMERELSNTDPHDTSSKFMPQKHAEVVCFSKSLQLHSRNNNDLQLPLEKLATQVRVSCSSLFRISRDSISRHKNTEVQPIFIELRSKYSHRRSIDRTLPVLAFD
ncbi:hypothetical protein CBM2606_A10142 [Cupriavidus taiwanensis]|nr:hypothetical protein CBM2606_A10142 [Cupriavidus taiwanensis]